MNQNQRIDLHDTLMSAVMKLVEGNPGAIEATTQLMKAMPGTDPDDAFGELGLLLSLDTHGIYGSDIWKLYKYVCDRDTTKVLTLLRAVQLGILSQSILLEVIETADSERLDFANLLVLVRERLPRFAA